MKHTVNKKSILLVTAIAIILFLLWYSGIMGLWIYGMAYIANNTKDFTDANSYTVQGKYNLIINLEDLQSNIGKELYNDGTNRIYVSWIDNTGSAYTGGYRIGFRSCGEYSLTGAAFVSGARHATVDKQAFTTYMTATMTAEMYNKTYDSHVYSTGGLNYKDGDDFSFYLFPLEAYDNGEISLTEKGNVQLTVTNLYKNVWTRK